MGKIRIGTRPDGTFEITGVPIPGKLVRVRQNGIGGYARRNRICGVRDETEWQSR